MLHLGLPAGADLKLQPKTSQVRQACCCVPLQPTARGVGSMMLCSTLACKHDQLIEAGTLSSTALIARLCDRPIQV